MKPQGITKNKLPNIKHIIIVASGKGGVGKSTVSAGLALSLAMEGYATGILDADMHGPSIPVLFNIQNERPEVIQENNQNLIIPFSRLGIKLMSIGFLVEPAAAVIWRGPRVSSAITQLITETKWGELDYLIIDTPPGTGDAHITLIQNFDITGVVIVTTPQKMALADVEKAIDMYRAPDITTPVIGIVENMAWFTPTRHADEKYYIFGNGGGKALSEKTGIPLLAQVPVNEIICSGCDTGKVQNLMDEPVTKSAFEKIAGAVLNYKKPAFTYVPQ